MDGRSHFTRGAESRYSPIKRDASAVVDALDKARYLVLCFGELIIAVRHKPLLQIFGNRFLDQLSNAHLPNIRENTLRYKFKMIHILGAKHRGVAAVSGNPTGNPEQMKHLSMMKTTYQTTCTCLFKTFVTASCRRSWSTIFGVEIQQDEVAASSITNFSIQTITWDIVRVATNSDDEIVNLVAIFENGILEFRHEQPFSLREYVQLMEGLSIYSRRRSNVQWSHCYSSLTSQTYTHWQLFYQHIKAYPPWYTMYRGESSVFWPGITPDIYKLDKCL